MKHGHIKAWLCKLLMYGAAGSGKTTSKEIIIGNKPPKDRVSTPLAMRPTTVYRVNLEGKEWAKLTTLEERKLFFARVLINVAPDLVDRLLATQSGDATTSTNEPISTVAEPQVRSKDQASSDLSKPPTFTNDQSPLAITESNLFQPLESFSSDEASETEVLQSVTTDEELVKLMGQLSTTVDPVAAFRLLHIIDSGGQPQFHEILPIFLRRLDFYVFVFRLCDELTCHPVVEFYIDGKPVGTPFTSAQTIEQLLQHCARSMHSHRSSSGSEGECPRIMILGTHLDKAKKSKEIRKKKNKSILKVLLPTLEDQIIYHNIPTNEVIFPLNALNPGRHEQDIIKQIREVLLGESSIPAADIPLRWFALEILLEEMTKVLQRGVLSRQECFTTAVDKLHFEDDAEFDAAIQYLDDLSVLLHYPSILPGVVFADPQVLLDKVTELVLASFKMNILSENKALSDEWRKYYCFALVTVEFLSLEDFSRHYVPGLFEAKHLVQLFKTLLIFAKISDTQSFVPALLRDLSSKDVDKYRVLSNPALALHFPDGGPRKGIFCSLLCWLVSPENDG